MATMLSDLRKRRVMCAVALVALLLVPIVVSGHHHVDSASEHACAMCAVVHHAPAVSTATLPTFDVALLQADILDRDITPAPPRADQAPGEGRAPPSVTFSMIV